MSMSPPSPSPSSPIYDSWSRRSSCSHNDFLWVLSYAPAHGSPGTPISVTFTCKGDLGRGAQIRLVVGRRAVSTVVRELPPPNAGRWQLDARVPPPLSPHDDPSPLSMLPLTIQALAHDSTIIDSVTFGDWTYTPPIDPVVSPAPSAAARDAIRLITGVDVDVSDRSSRRTSPYGHPHTPVSSESDHPPYRRRSASRSVSQPNGPSLRRTRQALEPTDQNTQSAVLDIMTPLDSFSFNWDESELQAGRRLVRFRRVQDRNRLMISAERISQAEYDPNDIVVSCIYRAETDTCCVTSVDIIHLLQSLVDAEFEVDEKNRIRRNLEGLRPTTVSKARPGFEAFFQRIMDFPDPKPRKIEKDLKVFDWKLLPQALEKIISKYSLYTSSFPDSPRATEDARAPLSAVETPSAFPPMKDEPLDYFPQQVGLSSAAMTCREPQLEVSPLAQLSPIMPLQYPAESRPGAASDDSLFALQDVPLPLFGGAVYGSSSSPSASSGTCQHGLVFESEQPQSTEGMGEWGRAAAVAAAAAATAMGHTNDVMLANGLGLGLGYPRTASQVVPLPPPHAPPMHGFAPPNSPDGLVEVFSPTCYPMNTYDSFEFQTLREHNLASSLYFAT